MVRTLVVPSQLLLIGIPDISRLSERMSRVAEITPVKANFNSESIPEIPESSSEPAAKVASAVPTVDAEAVQIPLAYYSVDHRKHVSSLNGALRRASSKISNGHWIGPQVHKETWKNYLMCRNKLLSAPQGVPLPVWGLLWKVFAARDEWNIERIAHIRYLGGDMIRSGITLSDPQHLLYIESVFVEGYRENAIKDWEAAEESLGGNKNMSGDYWGLGVRMLCQDGHVGRAIRAAEVLLEVSQDAMTSRILIPIIQACLASESESSVQKAWALYIRLRIGLGSRMEMQDYDSVTWLFLTANQQDLALGVFKDMMLVGDTAIENQDSVALYGSFSDTTTKPTSIHFEKGELNWQNSRVLAALPHQFNNKYFFGKWIKKLLGEAELDAARKVFDLMQERRICPDAKHTNGLIGAWFRAGTAKSQALAEDMAWKMIRARIDFVEARDWHMSLEHPLTAVKSQGKVDHMSPILVPRATIETFSLLIEQYRKRQKQDALLDLYRALERAKVRPNAFFLNQLLKAGLRSHRSKWAWETYGDIVQRGNVVPDLETFACLWQIEKREVDPVLNRDSRGEEFPTCRSLFAEMVTQLPKIHGKEEFSRDLYDLIILSFGLSDDQPGTAVALCALARHYGMYPADSTARSIVLQLARASQDIPGGHRARRLNLNKETKARVAQVTEMLGMVKEKRVEALLSQGFEFENLQGNAKAEESLMMLSDLLRCAVHARFGESDGLGGLELSHAAAGEMSVPDCVLWVA